MKAMLTEDEAEVDGLAAAGRLDGTKRIGWHRFAASRRSGVVLADASEYVQEVVRRAANITPGG